MQIEVGEFYRTQSGLEAKIVGRVIRKSSPFEFLGYTIKDGIFSTCWWSVFGTSVDSGFADGANNLVAIMEDPKEELEEDLTFNKPVDGWLYAHLIERSGNRNLVANMFHPDELDEKDLASGQYVKIPYFEVTNA